MTTVDNSHAVQSAAVRARMVRLFVVAAAIAAFWVGLNFMVPGLQDTGGLTAAYGWNLLGLVDFAVAVSMGFLSSPGRFQLLALDHSNILTSTYPTVMIPAFGVPSSIILHGLSLWQLGRLNRADRR